MAAKAGDAQAAKKQAKKRKREKPQLEVVNEAADDAGNSRLARALGSVDYQTREKGLQVLTRWLAHRDAVPDGDLAKIWKGLFYAFWHSDKQPVQAALAERLAQILPQLKPEVAFGYFCAFFITMRREWFGIDRLRLDKFMLLVRMLVHQVFTHLRDCQWDGEEMERFMGYLTEDVLLKQDGQPAVGLVYHLADCYLTELLEVDSEAHVPTDALLLLLGPFVQLLGHIQSSAGVTRVLAGVWQPLLEAAADPAVSERGSSFADGAALSDLAQRLFGLGASGDVKARNRDALYQLSQKLQKLAKKAGSSARKAAAANSVAAVAPAAPKAALAAIAALPPSSRKAAKKASRLARVTLASDLTAAPDAAVTPPAPDALPAAHTGSQKKKRKKQALSTAVAASMAGSPAAAAALPQQNGAAGLSTPVTDARPASAAARALRRMGAGSDGSPTSSAELNKSVHFRLKKNLYFEHGGPLPLPELRTPPSAQPKGPALRREAPSTDPAKLSTPAGRVRKSRLQSPRSIPRSKAAAFF